MTSLDRLQKNWEGLAQADPLWAICADAKRLGNKWTKEEFFATGEIEITRLLQYVESLGLRPERTGSALDFGCGVGRLTRALARRFHQCLGLDISATMVGIAQEFNQNCPGCRFQLNQRDDLSPLPDSAFAFI